MIKKLFLATLFFAAVCCSALANVNYIDIGKITADKNRIAEFEYLKSNLDYYKSWSPKWNYDVPKNELAQKLENIYGNFSKLDKNEELHLLLGDIAQYLYNLDASTKNTDYYDIAVKNYNKAIELDGTDYRAFWFLGRFYSQIPDSLVNGMKNFQAAEKLADEGNKDFWLDYANAALMTAMPSHNIYALDKAGQSYNREKFIKYSDKNQEYGQRDIWSVAKDGDKNFFISRSLGMKFFLTQEEGNVYRLRFFDYNKKMGGFYIVPSSAANKDGKMIDYTIAVIATPVDNKINLKKFLNNEMDKNKMINTKGRKEIKFTDKYDKTIAYEVVDKNVYKDNGGAHIYQIAIERDYPKYPGLVLEMPIPMPASSADYYVLKAVPDRFQGKIIYEIMLDTCQDIHDESLKVFKDFIENRLTIE